MVPGLFGSTAAGAGSIDVSSAFFGVCTTELMFACAGCGASIGEAGIGEAGIVEAGIAGALVSVCNTHTSLSESTTFNSSCHETKLID